MVAKQCKFCESGDWDLYIYSAEGLEKYDNLMVGIPYKKSGYLHAVIVYRFNINLKIVRKNLTISFLDNFDFP